MCVSSGKILSCVAVIVRFHFMRHTAMIMITIIQYRRRSFKKACLSVRVKRKYVIESDEKISYTSILFFG